MSSTFDATADAVTVAQAQVALDDLMAWVGVDGLVAALRSPGLLAAVDQHAAAVREAMVARSGAVDACSLAGYARSVIAAAYRMGRSLPEQTGQGCELDWSRAGWHLLRLVAVCAVADEAGCL
ncbi:MAG: hypothetical protein AUI14_10365 [Actinobacteria bacterium 13_2_20CM_2_71_6]|nr:MAG: hypothetical protein AUI14_10365 [Actinobacteria bacterium 13_2_20CM_2_71_6]